MSGWGSAAPTAVLQQAIRDFEGGAAVPARDYTPTKTWEGSKPGFYFGKGSQGIGYYRDAMVATTSAPEGGDADEGAGPSEEPPRSRAPDAAELLREAEETAGAGEVQIVDAKGLRRLVLNLERMATQNLEQRTRFPDDPSKFLDSELKLDEAIGALQVVASTPELYPDLIASGAIDTLLPLLSHENADVAAGVMELVAELTSEDALDEARAETDALAAALVAAGVLPALAHRLPLFDERVAEEAQAVHSALGVLEALVEVDPGLAVPVLAAPGLLGWALARVRARAADDVRGATAELLGILVQSGDEAKGLVAAGGGVDALLQACAPYRARDAADAEESEYVENLFTALCSLLMLPVARDAFVEGEGVELMLLVLKGRRAARGATLRCLDFATTSSTLASERLVDAGGLKAIFGIYMGKVKSKKADEVERQEEEERSMSIITNLFQNLSASARRDRVASKFVENEFEKVDRLVEIYLRYEARMATTEIRLTKFLGTEPLESEDLLLEQMEAGLFTLQQAALVLGELWLLQDAALRRRVLMLLHQKSHSLASVRQVLLGRRQALGVDGLSKEAMRQIDQINSMLVALGHTEGDGDGAVHAPTMALADVAPVREAGGAEEEEGRVAPTSVAASSLGSAAARGADPAASGLPAAAREEVVASLSSGRRGQASDQRPGVGRERRSSERTDESLRRRPTGRSRSRSPRRRSDGRRDRSREDRRRSAHRSRSPLRR